MRTIIGLSSLLLAAAIEFMAIVFYNSKTDPAYEAKIIKATHADTAQATKAHMTTIPTRVMAGQKTQKAKL